MKARLAERLKLQIAGGQVGLEVDPRGLVVSIREAGTFGVGSADLSDAARSVLGEVADALADVDHPVRIEGHTDDVPIRTAKYKSNWELSTARATNVVSFFVEDRGLPPSRFSAAGYGEFRPRAANTTGANRAANRRVDIVILNDATRSAEEPRRHAAARRPGAEPRRGGGGRGRGTRRRLRRMRRRSRQPQPEASRPSRGGCRSRGRSSRRPFSLGEAGL